MKELPENVERISDEPEVYLIKVVLPGNPLKTLNSYFLRSNGEQMLIDTGFNHPQTKASLFDGLKAVGFKVTALKLFLTHGHSDHTGLVASLLPSCETVFMNPADYPIATGVSRGEWHDGTRASLAMMGFMRAEVESMLVNNPIFGYSAPGEFAYEPVADGSVVTVGDASLRCIHTPGHSPGHICLLEPELGLLFTGDHVLFDISPNITKWDTDPNNDALGLYLQNLRRMRDMQPNAVLPGHRSRKSDSGSLRDRIDELLEHHQQRLDECLDAVFAAPGQTCSTIASKMKWRYRGNGWQDFPPSQKMFATGETMAHLFHLGALGRLSFESDGQALRFHSL
jgi:glyoxylase-like metal-dependent hydrolase (beta-lactamase superfamily II)